LGENPRQYQEEATATIFEERGKAQAKRGVLNRGRALKGVEQRMRGDVPGGQVTGAVGPAGRGSGFAFDFSGKLPESHAMNNGGITSVSGTSAC